MYAENTLTYKRVQVDHACWFPELKNRVRIGQGSSYESVLSPQLTAQYEEDDHTERGSTSAGIPVRGVPPTLNLKSLSSFDEIEDRMTPIASDTDRSDTEEQKVTTPKVHGVNNVPRQLSINYSYRTDEQ